MKTLKTGISFQSHCTPASVGEMVSLKDCSFRTKKIKDTSILSHLRPKTKSLIQPSCMALSDLRDWAHWWVLWATAHMDGHQTWREPWKPKPSETARQQQRTPGDKPWPLHIETSGRKAKADKNDKPVKDQDLLVYAILSWLLALGFRLDNPQTHARRIYRVIRLALDIDDGHPTVDDPSAAAAEEMPPQKWMTTPHCEGSRRSFLRRTTWSMLTFILSLTFILFIF